MRVVLSMPAWTALASAILYSGACGPAEDPHAGHSGIDIGDVLYEGGANDEALRMLIAREPVNDASQGTVFDAPDDGASLPAGAAPAFAWHVGGASGARLSPTGPTRRGAVISSLWLVLAGPERTARAHGPPLNGRGYFLVLTPAGGDPVRVFTTLLKYTPDTAAWDRLKAGGGPISASIIGGIFDNNRIATDGGPYAGQTITVSVSK